MMNLCMKDDHATEQGVDVGNALLELIEQNLGLTSRGFRLAFTRFDRPSAIKVIYDSECCRLKFLFSPQRVPRHDELSVLYGRLHAANEEPFMEWRGEPCRCWHAIDEPVRFLDGLSAREAAELTGIRETSPHRMEDFLQSEAGKKLSYEYPPGAVLVLHARIWERYAQRLFDLFDLRRSGVWEKYRAFVGEYYRLTGQKSIWGPQYENVC